MTLINRVPLQLIIKDLPIYQQEVVPKAQASNVSDQLIVQEVVEASHQGVEGTEVGPILPNLPHTKKA